MKIEAVDGSTPSMQAALPDLPMQQTVMVRILRIVLSSMTEFFDPVLRNVGLSENSFHVLCLLVASQNEPVSPSDLSQLIGTSRANVTRILETLEAQGYTSREVEQRDARRHVIHVTEAGRRATQAAVPQMITPLLRAFSDLSPDEFSTLDHLLRKVVLSLDKSPI